MVNTFQSFQQLAEMTFTTEHAEAVKQAELARIERANVKKAIEARYRRNQEKKINLVSNAFSITGSNDKYTAVKKALIHSTHAWGTHPSTILKLQ